MMTLLSHLLRTSLLLPLATALAAPTTRDLPECSRSSAQPCQCPAGTTYNTCTTYVTVGANAYDVRNLTGDFFDLSWIPQRIKETHGEDNTIGCTRNTTIAIDVGVYDWVEELIKYELGSDGSFLWEFKLDNVPLYFHPGPGLFAGEWVTYKAEYVSEYETKISWNLYGCHSGGMHGYSEFQRYILRHVQSLLQKDGKIKGNNTDPYSEIGAPRKMSLAGPVVAEGAESSSSSPMRHDQQVLDGGDKSGGARISAAAASSSASCAKDPSAAVESRLRTAWTPL